MGSQQNMDKNMDKKADKELIVAEYLMGGVSRAAA
jgi:hypothetical protein